MEARLQFGPGNSAGFTPAGIAAFSDLRPTAVVRELVQNAFDAAREAGQARAVVRFRLGTMHTDDIPDIDTYIEAFNAAIATQKEMGGVPAKADAIVQTIDDTLLRERQSVLAVLDNGIGLDDRRMTALLSDGVSAKGSDASGTYGNGHSVAIPASDLRYLLYGSVLKDGDTICAGHAVLASHAPIDDSIQHLCSGDGFFIRCFLDGRDGKRFEFAKGDQIPSVIRTLLHDVQAETQHGSVVIIPAFNNFRNKKQSLWEMVAEATSSNFFQALVEGRLVVHVEDETDDSDTDRQTLDSGNVAKVLIANSNKKRSKAFLSGEKAYSAYQALKFGTPHSVRTSYGSLRINLHDKPAGPPRVDLCRNGMWIADDKGIPGFYYKFRDRRPFHALLLLDPNNEQLYRLVREAEGPLHDRFDLKSMREADRRDLRAALSEIREWIMGNTDEIANTSFLADDHLKLDFGDSDGVFWGTPEAVGQRAPERRPVRSKGHRHHRNGEHKVRPSGRSRRRRVAPFFSAVSVPVTADRRRIAITCHQECGQAALELSVDENIDSTCDRVVRDSVAEVVLMDVTIDGQQADESRLLRRDGSIVGVRLGDLAKDQEVIVETSYSLPSYFGSVAPSRASLVVDVESHTEKGSDS